MSELDIDDKTRAALGRLTAGEKECLERRLQHQTAKEIALELGVSPHAVEKRLKMARAKLGLSSSLDAARLVAASERDQQTVPQTPDLATGPSAADTWPVRPLVIGAAAMSLATAVLIIFALQGSTSSGGVAPLHGGGVAPYPGDGSAPEPDEPPQNPAFDPDGRPIVWETPDPSSMVKASPTEMYIVVNATFTVLDRNKSGFIEPAETLIAGEGEVEQTIYSRDEAGEVRPTGEVRRVSPEQVRAEYIARGDTNNDGKWDFNEYREWMKPILAQNGIPAAWREDIESQY
jgi:DNA-binding CsgD family transcriptional regulator